MHAPRRDMHRVGDDQPDVAIDAGARIPARIGLQRIVDAHGDDIRLAVGAQIGRQVVDEGDVAIGPQAQGMTVDPDFAALIDAVELDGDALSAPAAREGDRLAIPADTGDRVAAGPAAGRGLIQWQPKAPVMRQGNRRPVANRKGRILRARMITQTEAPAVIESDFAPLTHYAGRGRRQCRRRRQGRDGRRLGQQAHQTAPRQMIAHGPPSCTRRRISVPRLVLAATVSSFWGYL